MTKPRAAAYLEAAYQEYLRALENYQAIQPCRSAWPSDPPGPDYPGTVCDLTEDHTELPAEDPDHRHRHRILGTTTDVTW